MWHLRCSAAPPTLEGAMKPTLKLTVFATLTAFAIAGCNADAGGPMMPGGDPGSMTGGGGDAPTNNPDNPNPQPKPVASYSGVYDVKSNLDFTQNGVLPGALGPALAGLSELHDHPGDALLTILKGANIPYVSDILNKIPSFLTSALAGLLDDVIVNNVYKGYPVVDEIANIVMGLTEISKNID